MSLARRVALKQKTPLRPSGVLRPKAKSASWYRTKCDIYFSQYIRREGICVRCGRRDNLQCAHIISRSVQTIRCHPLNAICLCWSCHLGPGGWHKDPLAAAAWFEATYPGRYRKLQDLSNTLIGKKVDWKAQYEYYQAGLGFEVMYR